MAGQVVKVTATWSFPWESENSWTESMIKDYVSDRVFDDLQGRAGGEGNADLEVEIEVTNQ